MNAPPSPASQPDARRRMFIIAGGAGLLSLAVGGMFLLVGPGAQPATADDARAALSSAGCTSTVKPAVANLPDHSDFPDPSGTSPKWNTDPPTSGPHYVSAYVYGAYTSPVVLGRVVHNLEHGAVFVAYGDAVPDETVAELRTFYDAHRNGTILAPYPRLGVKIALGAWLAEGLPEAASARGSGLLAECTKFDQAAFDAFFEAFQFKGPESFGIRPSDMEPGDN